MTLCRFQELLNGLVLVYNTYAAAGLTASLKMEVAANGWTGANYGMLACIVLHVGFFIGVMTAVKKFQHKGMIDLDDDNDEIIDKVMHNFNNNNVNYDTIFFHEIITTLTTSIINASATADYFNVARRAKYLWFGVCYFLDTTTFSVVDNCVVTNTQMYYVGLDSRLGKFLTKEFKYHRKYGEFERQVSFIDKDEKKN